ncbi:MAG TPA: hypothetical protein VGE93_22875 [Bryobacteraceae bacterium]
MLLQIDFIRERVGTRQRCRCVYTEKGWGRFRLLHLRDLQTRTGGFAAFVPLAFVATETPIDMRGQLRFGPTRRESVLMRAVDPAGPHAILRDEFE